MSGARAMGPDRIQFTLWYRNQRYRVTVARASTEANLRRARKQLEDIEARIANGTFSFAEEFPDYRYMDELPKGTVAPPLKPHVVRPPYFSGLQISAAIGSA